SPLARCGDCRHAIAIGTAVTVTVGPGDASDNNAHRLRAIFGRLRLEYHLSLLASRSQRGDPAGFLSGYSTWTTDYNDRHAHRFITPDLFIEATSLLCFGLFKREFNGHWPLPLAALRPVAAR